MSRTQLFSAIVFLTFTINNSSFASDHAPYADFGFKSMDHWTPTAKAEEKRSKEDEAKPDSKKPATPTKKQLLPARVSKALAKTSSAPAIVAIVAASASAQRVDAVSPHPDLGDYADFYLITPKNAPLSNSKAKPKYIEQDLEKVAEKD